MAIGTAASGGSVANSRISSSSFLSNSVTAQLTDGGDTGGTMNEFAAHVPDRFRSALAGLLTAYDYALDAQVDRWQFAVELPTLLAGGATLADVRWLIARRLAEHGKEITIPGDAQRSFRSLTATSFPPDTCLTLSSDARR